MLAAAADVVVIFVVVMAVTIAIVIVPVAAVALVFALRCTAISSFCCAGWLLPVTLPLSLTSLQCVPLWLIVVFAAYFHGGAADDNAAYC